MCLLCIETAKEKLKPKEFWQNYKELEISEEHLNQLNSIISNTSIKYQQELLEEMPPSFTFEVNYE